MKELANCYRDSEDFSNEEKIRKEIVDWYSLGALLEPNESHDPPCTSKITKILIYDS